MNIHNESPLITDLNDVTVHSGKPWLTRKPSADSIIAYVATQWSVPHAIAEGWLRELFVDPRERELATEAATSDIECHTDRDGDWWLLDSAGVDDAEWVERAVKYLDSRGLLTWDRAANKVLITTPRN